MVLPLTPFCDVEKINDYLEGSVVDFGYCLNERVTSQVANENYVLSNLILEPNTDTLIVKPEISYRIANDLTNWTVVTGSYWNVSTVTGYPQNRKLMKWSLADPDEAYAITSGFSITAGVGYVLEIGLLPSDNTATEPTVDITIGTLRFTIGKRSDPKISVLKDAAWVELATVPISLRAHWKDVNTEFIWVIPYMGGLLIGTTPDNLTWIYPPGGFTLTTGNVSIAGKGGIAAFGVHEIAYSAASITSESIDIGYTPETTVTKALRGWLEAEGVDCTSACTWTLQETAVYKYQATITPGNMLAGLSKIEIAYPPNLLTSSGSSSWVYDVVEVNEQIPEDPTEEVCQITLDNTDLAHTGAYKKFDTLKWHFGWTFDDGAYTSYERNYGFIVDINDQRTEGSDPILELKCRPPVHRLLQNTVISAPNYAGWDVSSMLADFLHRHGVPLDKQSIDTSYALIDLPDPGDDSWEPKYGDPVRKWVEDIVYHTVGGWIYSGRDGKIHIEPYQEVEEISDWTEALQIYPYQISELSYPDSEDATEDFRNIFLVQGMDTDGYPLAAVYKDMASLKDPSSDRFTGYPLPYTTVHKGYCTQAFIDATLASVVARYNVKRNVVQFTTKEQSGSAQIFPGSLTQIVRENNKSDWVLVRSVSSTLAHGKFQQTVYGHYTRRST